MYYVLIKNGNCVFPDNYTKLNQDTVKWGGGERMGSRNEVLLLSDIVRSVVTATDTLDTNRKKTYELHDIS